MGERTLVETTVAIEFAASCQPLEKSNANAAAMMKKMKATLGILDDDRFENVGDVLATIGRRLERFHELLLLDQENRVADLAENLLERTVESFVPVVLEGVDADARFENVVPLQDVRHGALEDIFIKVIEMDGAVTGR